MSNIKVNLSPDCWTMFELPESKKNEFYDEEMLDYLLDDIITQKAKESERILNETCEKLKKKAVNDFINDIKWVKFSDPATIIQWKNGEKTVVKCQDGEVFDPEKGLALAIIKHFFDDTSYYNTIFKKFCNEV